MATLSGATAREHLKRMVPLQEAGDTSKNRLADTKREARADGLNIDAVNALLPLLSKHPHDKAAAVLKEIVRYAEAYGAVVSTGPNEDPLASTVRNRTTDSSATAEGTKTGTGFDLEGHRSRNTGLRITSLRVPAQVFMAALLALGLIWLLN